MARGRKKAVDQSQFNSREQKLQIIRETFPQMRSLMLEKAGLMAEHIKPVSDNITKLGRNLKANTGVERADWWPDFLKFMRDQNAIDMDSAADTQRIQTNLRLMHDALTAGEMVNFLDALEKAGPDPMLHAEGEQNASEHSDDDGETGHSETEDDGEREPAGLTFASAETDDADPMLEETTQAWAATEGTEDGGEYDKGGYTFAEGKTAGLAGTTAEQNPHPVESPSHDLWERGRVAGSREFVATESAQIADEIEAGDGGSVIAPSSTVVNLFDDGDDDEGGVGGAEFGDDDRTPQPVDAEASHAAQA